MATITSAQTGDWHATGTWEGGAVPANNDLVVIAHGHKVTISTDITAAITDNVTIDGNLHFADGGKMHLNGRMTVKNTSNANNTAGEFTTDDGDSGSLLSMAAGSLIKISGDNSAQHGIQIDARAWCGVDIDGGEPTLKTELNGNHIQQSSYLTVDDSANFTANDLISIYKREEDFRLANDECFWVHDVDTENHRIYFRQFVYPRVTNKAPIISNVSGATITVDDANVFRVGYLLIFGTGDNRNVLKITAINGKTNVITFGSTVDNAPSLIGEYVYQTGTEKYHLNDSHVRRTSSAMAATYSGATDLRTVVVNNAADFSSGDKIYIEACGDDSYNYVSGGETNVWRHRLVYTISSISGTTITVDRDILYDGKIGGLITKMSRGVVIKACAANGDDIAYANQDTARVFFNVKYWTNNTWNAAPTRRVKIKYVEFDGLGYNTYDETNFRSGVNISGYNGYYDTKITGAAADNTTIHNSSGVTQTGENYIDGCSYTAYNLCSNTTRDGDEYPAITIRHPYGMVARNLVTIGTGRGVWHWSSQHFIKSHGHISAANSYCSLSTEATYERPNEISYMYLRMAEDYNWIYYNLGRQNDMTTVQHFDIQYANSYCMHSGGANRTTSRRIYCDKYRYIYATESIDEIFLDSQFMPNYWDASSHIWGMGHTPNYDTDQIRHYASGHNKAYISTGTKQGKQFWIEHGFRQDEYVEYGASMTLLIKGGTSVHEFIVTPAGNPQLMASIFVPAHTVVKLRSRLKINDADYDGVANTVADGSMPVLIARSIQNSGFGGRHNEGVVTDSGTVRTLLSEWDIITSADDRAGIKTSTQTYLSGSLYTNSFVEYIPHTSTAQGAWETKTLTVASQSVGYELAYGYYVDDHDITTTGFKALPIDVILSKASLHTDHLHTTKLGRKSVRTSFTANKKRLSGRI